MKKALNRVGKKMNLVFALLIVLLIAAVVLIALDLIFGGAIHLLIGS